MADYGGPGDTFLRGYGLALQGQSNDLRRQQLISEDRARRLQEAQTAQHMALLMDQHNSQVDYEASLSKAAGAVALATAPTIAVEDPEGISGTVNIPNPQRMSHEDALLKFVAPAVAKGDPKAYVPLMNAIALSAVRKSMVDKNQSLGDLADARVDALGQPKPRSQEELDLMAARAEAARAAAGLSNTKSDTIKETGSINPHQFAPTVFKKNWDNLIKARQGGDPEEIAYWEKHTGVSDLTDADKAVMKAGVTAISNDPTLYKAEDKQKKIAAYVSDFMASHAAKTNTPSEPASLPASLPASKPITSKSEYDALEKGATFVGSDGKLYKKP